MLLYVFAGWLYLGSPIVMLVGWTVVMWVAWLGGLYVMGRVLRRASIWTPDHSKSKW